MDDKDLTDKKYSSSSHALAALPSVQNDINATDQGSLKCSLTTIDNKVSEDRHNDMAVHNESQDQDVELHKKPDVSKVNKDIEDTACNTPESSSHTEISECHVTSNQTANVPAAHRPPFPDTATSHNIGSSQHNIRSSDDGSTGRSVNRNSENIESRDQDVELHKEPDVSKVKKDIEDTACNTPESSSHKEISDFHVSSNQTSNVPTAHRPSSLDTATSHNIGFCPHNLRSSNDGSVNRRSDNIEHEYDVTSDIGDECSESEENSNENQPFISNIYVCPSCGWAPEMEKCLAHRSVQAGYTNGMYQFQGIIPSQTHGFSNYNYGSYAAGQRPGYPCGVQVVPTTMDMRFNPATHQVVASSASTQNQNLEDYTRTIQSLRRKTFCLSISVIFLVFAVITLAILIS